MDAVPLFGKAGRAIGRLCRYTKGHCDLMDPSCFAPLPRDTQTLGLLGYGATTKDVSRLCRIRAISKFPMCDLHHGYKGEEGRVAEWDMGLILHE